MHEDDRPSRDPAEPSRPPSDPAFWEAALGGRANAAWLLQDPEIDAAIRDGNVLRVHQVFTKRLSAAPTVEAHAALARVLKNRRLFLEPLRSAPGLATLNGIGARTYGAQERDPADGTYVTTRFLTLLYLPLWPLAQYLVAKAPGKGWYFLGRVPLSPVHRWWRRAVFVGCVALVLGIGLSAWRQRTTSEVHFLNGLPVPVAVTMGEEVVEVAAGAREARVLRVGRHHVTARGPGGVVLEERDVDVPHGMDFVAYNVLGSAPLVLETIAYSAAGADTKRAEEMNQGRTLAGESWVVEAAVDWTFRAAPPNIQMPSGTLIMKRTRMDVYEGDWRTTATHLLWEGRPAEAAALARVVASLLPENEEAHQLAVGYSLQAGEAEPARELLVQALAKRPNDIDLHRGYQSVMETLGRLDEVLPTYRAAHEQDPHDARAGYLYARILDSARARPILESLTAEHPDDPWLLRGLAWAHYQAGRFDEALPHHTRLLALRPDEAGYFVGIVAQELVAVGRAHEALTAVGDVFDGAEARTARGEDPLAGTDGWRLMGLYARLRRLAGDPTDVPDVAARWRPLLQGQAPDADLLARTAARARDEGALAMGVDAGLPAETLNFCRLTLLSRSAPDEAAALALEADESTLLRLDDEVQIVVACELLRQGARERAELVLGGLSPPLGAELHLGDLEALPAVAGLSEDIEPVHRAALLVAASRRVEDATRREALLAEARRLDVLRLVVPE